MKNLKELKLPDNYNYIACFLTLDCNLKCEYCINNFGITKLPEYSLLSGEDWVKGLNRLVSRADLPITLQGGEPALHPDFIWVINNIKDDLNIDVITNLMFDVDKFIKEIDPGRLKRAAPYANIRVSYHRADMSLTNLIEKVLKLQKAGFYIGVYGILHPQFVESILEAQKECRDKGIDFRTKEFLGKFEGKLYGTYLYPDAFGNAKREKCLCRTTEIIIGSDANIYRCHHDLYKNFRSIGNLLNPDLEIEDIFRECNQFGDCNPCDIKIKTNRFQVFGHTSVEIKDIEEVV